MLEVINFLVKYAINKSNKQPSQGLIAFEENAKKKDNVNPNGIPHKNALDETGPKETPYLP